MRGIRSEPSDHFSTSFLLFAQYGGKAAIPVEDVCRDYFNHLTPEKFLRKVAAGEIPIPVVRAEASQKCQKSIHLQDLADYLDSRRAAALKEFQQLHGGSHDREDSHPWRSTRKRGGK